MCVRTNEHIPSLLRNVSWYVCSDIINTQYAFIFNYVPIYKNNLKYLGSKYASYFQLKQIPLNANETLHESYLMSGGRKILLSNIMLLSFD